MQKVSSYKLGFHIYVGLYTSCGHQCFMLVHADGLVVTGFHTHAESYVHIYSCVSLCVWIRIKFLLLLLHNLITFYLINILKIP